MKAYQLQDAFGFENVRMVDLPEPKAGPGQVVLKMHAWSLNFRDLLVIRGHYNPRLAMPMIPLSDGAGEVVAMGEGVTDLKIGDRVAGIFMADWVEGELDDAKGHSARGGSIQGMLAEYVVTTAHGVIPIPNHLSYEEAATLPCAAVTAWHALVTAGKVGAASTVLVQGTGGVSLFALQFAKLHGARVVATSSSDAKLERLRELGADCLINYKTTPAWSEPAKAFTGGVGVDHVVEVGGAGTMAESLRAVKTAGRISLIGVLTGPGQFDGIPILMKNILVNGIYVGSRVMFADMNKAITAHRLRPIIDRSFPFDDFIGALKHMESGAHFGKIVIKR